MKTLIQSTAPEKKVSPCANVVGPGYGNKGYCRYCQEIFNQRDPEASPDVCPECADIFCELESQGIEGAAN